MTALTNRMAARRPSVHSAVFCLISVVSGVSASANVIAVEPDTPSEGRWTISSPSYRMVLNLASPRIDSFETANHTLIGGGVGFAPTINTGAPWGPAQATIAMDGPAVTQIVLYGMRWEESLIGDIELHFFCYPNRVVARMDIIPRAAPPTLLLGWVGNVSQAAPFPVNDMSPDWHSILNAKDALAPAALLLPPLLKGVEGRRGAHVRFGPGSMVNAHFIYNAHDIGVRSIACTLVAGTDAPTLLDALSHEVALRRMQFDVTNGRFVHYDDTTGLQRFIIKPGADTMRIAMVGAVDPVGPAYIAAVSDQSRRNFRVETPQSNPVDVQWMRKRFNASPTPSMGEPGNYVFPLRLTSDDQILRLHEIDSVQTSVPASSANSL